MSLRVSFSSVCFFLFLPCIDSWTKNVHIKLCDEYVFFPAKVIEMNTKNNRRAEKKMTAKREAFPFSVREQRRKKVYTKHIQCWRPLKTLHLILIHSLHTMTLSFLYMVFVRKMDSDYILRLDFLLSVLFLSIFLQPKHHFVRTIHMKTLVFDGVYTVAAVLVWALTIM